MLYIAENLKRLRKAKNLTQKDIAEMLGISLQSVSKWERGDTMPDVTFLPPLANLYNVSVDTLLGMDRINEQQAKSAIFITGYKNLREGCIDAAINAFSKALKTYPDDESIMSKLAISYALSNNPVALTKALTLCECILTDNQGDKVPYTTLAALCFIYLKAGKKDKAIALARKLPCIRESCEVILAYMEKYPSADEINSYLRFITIGESENHVEIET